MLSRTARYALRAVVYMAERSEVAPLLVRDMAEELEVPRNYLSKILHRLAQAGLLASTRGRGGGFELARSAHDVTLREVIECVEPTNAVEAGCLLGRGECSDEDPCPAHGRWCVIGGQLERFFRETTLADLARRGGPVPS